MSVKEKLESVVQLLQNDLQACDLKCSIFVSAAKSFKRDFLMVPFPSSYLGTTNVKDFDKLINDITKLPALADILANETILPDEVVNLLHYILTFPKFQIESTPKSKYSEVLALSPNTTKIPIPTKIFKIKYSDDSGAEKKFQQLLKDYGTETKYAYHGTKFLNFYSILNFGLQQHLNKTGLFGEGLYFSNELQVSLMFSPFVVAWAKSTFGEMLSAVAICEYIADEKYVNIRNENSKNSDIPISYVLIKNNEIVRVRYLLIYSQSKLSQKIKEIPNQERKGVIAWCKKNPLIISSVIYVGCLFLVGISNHRVVQYYRSKFWKSLNDLYEVLSKSNS
ncbi:unnamed protein product [Diamesa serratosioi]